jgi:hypothetical protein
MEHYLMKDNRHLLTIILQTVFGCCLPTLDFPLSIFDFLFIPTACISIFHFRFSIFDFLLTPSTFHQEGNATSDNWYKVSVSG